MRGYIHIKAVEENDGTAVECKAELKNISMINRAQIMAAVLNTLGIDASTAHGAEQVAVLIAVISSMKRTGDFEEEAYGIRI